MADDVVVERFDAGEAADADIARVHEVLGECHREVNAVEPYRAVGATAGFLRYPPADERRLCWRAVAAGEVLGFAVLMHLRDAASARAEVQVRPGRRRRGVGSALLGAVREEARTLGARTLLGRFADAAGDGFRRAMGASAGQRDVRAVLRTGNVLPPPVPVRGYRLAGWTGACPPELLASYARARAAVNDAPHADAEPEPWDPARVRGLEEAVARRGTEIRVHALLGPDGAVVAFTEIRIAPPGAAASIEDTAVLRSHRGRGLGGWLKAASLADLRAHRPDVAFTSTSNAAGNAPIRAINRGLGFVTATEWTTAVLDLGRA